MIGIFDSGVGGICAYRQVRKMLPYEDLIYLADRKNAPYGTKSEDEIVALTKNNIKQLKNMGVRAILIACCSASSLHHRLTNEERVLSTPIITPAAEEAARIGRKITVIATEHTARSKAFSREIAKLSDATVTEMAEQRLVALVERGNRDGRIDVECERYLTDLVKRIRMAKSDTLILGCTHFSHLEQELGRLLPEVKIISPARVGAIQIVKKIDPSHKESGRDVYI